MPNLQPLLSKLKRKSGRGASAMQEYLPRTFNVKLPASEAATFAMKKCGLGYKEYTNKVCRPLYFKRYRQERKILRAMCAQIYLPKNDSRQEERKLRHCYYVALPILMGRLLEPSDQKLIWCLEDIFYGLLFENRLIRRLTKPIRLSTDVISKEERFKFYLSQSALAAVDPGSLDRVLSLLH